MDLPNLIGVVLRPSNGMLIWIYFPVPVGYGRDLTFLVRFEVLWIPITLYLLGIVFAGIIFGIQKVSNR